jgi:ketosteroid isomerase-like protein
MLPAGRVSSRNVSMIDEKNGERGRAAITRRVTLAGVGALAVAGSADGAEPFAGLVNRAAAKNAAFMNGDMQRWLTLARIAPDFTLMQPFGGPASHGFDPTPARLADMAGTFKSGKTTLELEHAYASGAMVVLVMIERQTAEVGGLPEQDWSLRVTEVYRKDGSNWQLVHRHADPLVQRRSLEETAMLARGGEVK